MMKKACISIIVFVAIIIMGALPAIAVDYTITVTDPLGDVLQYVIDEEEPVGTYDAPNIDILEVKAEQTGNGVTLTLTVSEEGIIEKSENSMYIIFLATTSPDIIYSIYYAGWIEMYSDEVFMIEHGHSEVDVDDYSIENNILSVSFKLSDSRERIMGLYAMTYKDTDSDSIYADEAPDDVEEEMMGLLIPDAGRNYSTTVGVPIDFQATLEEGNPEDYEWLWVFEDTGITLTGSNPIHTFSMPDTYYGILYVFDGEGKWGIDEFSVTITGDPIDTNGTDKPTTPGFEIILFLIAITLLVGTLFIFKRKK
jgi:hypothetical protein